MIKKHRDPSNGDGFTIVEIIVSLAIMSFIIVALASLFSSFLLIKRANSNLLKATTIAENTVESFRTKTYNGIASLSDYSTIIDNYYTQNINFLPIEVEGIDVIKISIAVQWEENNRAQNKDREYKIETFVSENGLNRYLGGSE